MEAYDFVSKYFGTHIKTIKYGRSVKPGKKRKKETAEEFALSIKDLDPLKQKIYMSIFESRYKRDETALPKGRKLSGSEIEKFSDLMEMNFSVGYKYLTLTYEEEDVSIDKAASDFENWIKRMRERYGDFKYLAVRSFQKRGAIHFHVLTNLPHIPKRQLIDGSFREIWGHGNIDLKTIYNSQYMDHIAKLKRYLIKNLREFKADERSYGKRLYLKSDNLLEPVVMKGSEEDFKGYLEETGIRVEEIDSRRFDVEYLEYMEKKTYKIVK